MLALVAAVRRVTVHETFRNGVLMHFLRVVNWAKKKRPRGENPRGRYSFLSQSGIQFDVIPDRIRDLDLKDPGSESGVTKKVLRYWRRLTFSCTLHASQALKALPEAAVRRQVVDIFIAVLVCVFIA